MVLILLEKFSVAEKKEKKSYTNKVFFCFLLKTFITLNVLTKSD